MLVMVPNERVLRAFFLDTTSEKNMVYLVQLVLPLYAPLSATASNYMTRLPDKDTKLHIDPSDHRRSAQRIADLIRTAAPVLRRIQRPADFLRHIEWRIGTMRNILFNIDVALTYYLVGNVRESADLIKSLRAEAEHLDKRGGARLGPLLDRMMGEIETNPRGLLPLLDEWQEANFRTLGLENSRYLSVVPGQAHST